MKKITNTDGFKNYSSLIPSSIKMFKVVSFIAMMIGCTVAYVPTIDNPQVPQWAPSYNNTSNAQYYYLPDIEVYYDIVNHDFVYLENNQWMFSNVLPPSYDWYDLNSCYTVVLDARVHEPWKHFSYYVSHYPRYYYRTYYKNNIQNNKRVWGFNENDSKEVYSHHGEQENEGHFYNGEYNNQNHSANQQYEQHNNQYQQTNNQNSQYYGQNQNTVPVNNQHNSQNVQATTETTPNHQNNQYNGQNQNTVPLNNQHNPQNGQSNTQQGSQTIPSTSQGQTTMPHQGALPNAGQNPSHQNATGQSNQGQVQNELPPTEAPHLNNHFPGKPVNLAPIPTETPNPTLNNNHQRGNSNQSQNQESSTEPPHPSHFTGMQINNTRPAVPMQFNDKNVGKPVKVKKDMMRPQP